LRISKDFNEKHNPNLPDLNYIYIYIYNLVDFYNRFQQVAKI